MYYSEKIIDGILCYKHSPHAEYKPMTPKMLTKKIVELNKELDSISLAL